MLSWLGKSSDIHELIAKKQYGKAIKALEAEIAREPDNVHLRQRLADALELDGKDERAVEVLLDVVDRYARDGFVSKGLAILKKIQRLDPDAPIGDRLEELMKLRGDDAPVRTPSPRPRRDDRDPDSGTFSLEDTSVPYVTSELVRSEVWLDAVDERDDFHWSPLFSGLPEEALTSFFAGLHLRIKSPGSIVYTEGEAAGGLYVLASGTARVYRRDVQGRNRQITVLSGGSFFGIHSLLHDTPRRHTVVAATACELLEIDPRLFERLVDEHPELRDRVERLREESAIV